MEHPFFHSNGRGEGAARLLQALRMDLKAEEFAILALELLRQQARDVPAYRRFLAGLEVDPATCTSWEEFPALPASAFRDQAVCGFDPARAVEIFETSGTTSGQTGRHYFAGTAYYERALETAFRAMMPDLSGHAWVMVVPPRSLRPRSSLSFMLSHLAPVDAAWCCDEEYRMDVSALRRAVAEAGRAVALFGTSFALADLAEVGGIRLPHGSVVFDTGGTKGRRRALNREEFLELMSTGLGVEPSAVWNEYGMTEWSSQGYARLDEGLHRFPPWMHLRLCHPVTGAVVPPGEVGLVHAYDLANVGSVMAVATRDAARWEVGPGGPGLRLLGRWTGAEERGCSLPYE
jgi:hypothetical protein